MTHADLDKQYNEVLGRGLYTPQVLLPRLRRAIEAAGFTVSLETSDDLRSIPPEAIPVAIDYLKGKRYGASPDAARAADIIRKAS